MLFPILHYLLGTGVSTKGMQELLIAHFALVTFNVVIALTLGKTKGIEYLGQVNMLALTAALLSIPIMLVNKYLHIQNASFNSFYFGMLAIVIINEYRRRMKFANIIPHNKGIVLVSALSVAIFIYYLLS